MKAGKSVFFTTLADIVTSLAKAEPAGQLKQRLTFYARNALLIIDEIGYLHSSPVAPTCSSNSSTPATNAAR